MLIAANHGTTVVSGDQKNVILTFQDWSLRSGADVLKKLIRLCAFLKLCLPRLRKGIFLRELRLFILLIRIASKAAKRAMNQILIRLQLTVIPVQELHA